MKQSSKIDPDKINIPDDAWELVEVTEDFERHRAPLERYPDGNVLYVYRTTPRALVETLEDNRRLFDESSNKRFGDGKIVGRIPLNILYRDVVPRIQQGDQEFLKWFLNKSDNRMYRTFRGTV